MWGQGSQGPGCTTSELGLGFTSQPNNEEGKERASGLAVGI